MDLHRFTCQNTFLPILRRFLAVPERTVSNAVALVKGSPLLARCTIVRRMSWWILSVGTNNVFNKQAVASTFRASFTAFLARALKANISILLTAILVIIAHVCVCIHEDLCALLSNIILAFCALARVVLTFSTSW